MCAKRSGVVKDWKPERLNYWSCSRAAKQ